MIKYFFLFMFALGFSQSDLKSIVEIINSQKHADTLNPTNYKLMKQSFSISGLFENESINSLSESRSVFSIYVNSKNDTIIKIRDYYYKYVELQNDIRLFVCFNGSFFIYENKTDKLFYIETEVGSYMAGYVYPSKIEKIISIHYLNQELNPIGSTVLADGHIIYTSYFEYAEFFFHENIYLEKPNFERTDQNILSFKLKKLLYILSNPPLSISFYRKITLKINNETKTKDFWFLNPNNFF